MAALVLGAQQVDGLRLGEPARALRIVLEQEVDERVPTTMQTCVGSQWSRRACLQAHS